MAETVLRSPWFWLVVYLLVINLVTFLTFGLDKWKAKRKETKETVHRVPERTLFLLSILGGSIGGLLGMQVWRHKTKHWSFRIGIPLILVLQILLPIAIWYLQRQG